MKYHHLVLGGTFDHFHLGHQRLIEKGFGLSKKVTIGIVKKNLYENKFLSQTVESYSIRKNSVSEFLTGKGWLKRAKIVSIYDIYGTTLIDKTIEAIVVSSKTKRAAKKINEKRLKIGLPLMKIVVIDDVLADDGKLIASERIRRGEIDRQGRNYQLSVFSHRKKKLVLPQYLRKNLRQPLGKVFKNTKSLFQYLKKIKRLMMIAVGDIIVLELLKDGINPELKVIDLRTRRKEFSITNFQSRMNFLLPVLKKKYKNSPGTINVKTALKLKTLISTAFLGQKPHLRGAGEWLVVDGEEDLLVLPAILFAPLGSLVLYGQMDLGVVVVEVAEEIKNKVKLLLEKFY